MTDLKYDPELPFAFISTANREVARFADREIAVRFGREVRVGKVIDTTPKPKIPDGAEFIYWQDSKGDHYARRASAGVEYPGSGGWAISDFGVAEEYVIREIGDAEVTVLVPKEEP